MKRRLTTIWAIWIAYAALPAALTGCPNHAFDKVKAVSVSPSQPEGQPLTKEGSGKSLAAAPIPPPPAAKPIPTPAEVEANLDSDQMMARVTYLSETIGTRREGSAKERQAAAYVREQFADYGYQVSTESVPLPDGSRSQNVTARPIGWADDPAARYVVVAAHYDSRNGTPGANDNASGVAVMLEVARLLADVRTPHPVEYVAFGAEERFEARYAEKAHRGNGSQYHVAHLSPAERRRILGMVSLDMVGVGKVMQIGTLGEGSRRFADHLLWQAKACGVSAEYFVTKPWSDHVAFEQADIPAAWLWWWPDRDFHTPRDRWSRIDREKLRATARVTLRGLLRPLEE